MSYDLLVDPDSYETVRDGDGKLRVTLSQAAAVTGLKFPAGTDVSNLTIAITEEAGTVQAGHCPPEVPRDGAVVTYFQRPGADETQRAQVWTYQAQSITLDGLDVAPEDVALISYMGDDIAFLDGATIGRMAENFPYGPGPEDVIAKGTLVVVGTYRGDPAYNTVRLEGEFPAPDMAEDAQGEAPPAQGEVRAINGTAILFAEESSDNTYTNISNGLFLFVPDVQAEEELTGNTCGVAGVLPSRVRAALYRTDEPGGEGGARITAQTLWISSPGGADLPLVDLKGDGQ